MHVDIDKFAAINSPIHIWDTRCKIISLMILIFCISTLKSIEAAIFSLLISLILIGLSRLPYRFISRRVLYIALFLVPLFLFLVLTSGGNTFISFGFIKLYREGIVLSFMIFIKMISIVLIFFIMFGTSSFNHTAVALKSLKIPSKLVNLLLFTYRYIFVYLEDLRKMRSALVLRGYRTRNSIRSLKSTANLIGSLLVRSFEQSEQIYKAMTLRGFNDNIVSLDEFHIDYVDIIKLALTILISIFIFFWEYSI